MFFVVASLIVAIAGSMVTIKTLVGYNQFSLWFKLSVAGLVVVGWLAPILTHFLRRGYEFLGAAYPYIYNFLYLLFGLAFILLILLLVRDFIWVGGWKLSRLWSDSQFLDPYNPRLIARANLLFVVLSMVVCGWAVWEAVKIPEVKTVSFSSEKLDREYRLVMLSDLHINRATPLLRIRQLVNDINMLNPDVIVLTGDTIDDNVVLIEEHLKALKELSAPFGVYSIMGNHEFYAGARDWAMAFSALGFRFLNNYGDKIGNTGIYLAGIPDINAAQRVNMPIKTKNALYKAEKDDFVIMLSHTPKIAEGLTSENVDLQLSGHTHGGQIYPFHYFVAAANDGVLSGFYNKNGIKMYVSRGTRYWGPPMRIFAPAEITVFNLKATSQAIEKNTKTEKDNPDVREVSADSEKHQTEEGSNK